MNNTEKREKNILASKEKFEAFKNSLKCKLTERLLNTPLQKFSFDGYAAGFTVILPKTNEFPYTIELYLCHYESRTGLSIDWTKAESGENPEVYEVRPATMHIYINIYNAYEADNEGAVHLKRYANTLSCAGYEVSKEFYYEYNQKDDPELYEKLYKLYTDARANYKARCKTICEAYTKECWKLFDIISEPLQNSDITPVNNHETADIQN